MGRKLQYRPGSFYRVSDRTGFPQRAENTRQQWDNVYTEEGLWEARHPQDFVKGVRDDQTVDNARPITPPTFIFPVWTHVTADIPIYGTSIPLESVGTFGIGSHVAVMLDSDMGDMFHTFVTFVGVLGDGSIGIVLLDPVPRHVSAGQQLWNFSPGTQPEPPEHICWVVAKTPPDPSVDTAIAGTPTAPQTDYITGGTPPAPACTVEEALMRIGG